MSRTVRERRERRQQRERQERRKRPPLPSWTWLLGPAWAAVALVAGLVVRERTGDGTVGLLGGAAAYGVALGVVFVVTGRMTVPGVVPAVVRSTWTGLLTVSVVAGAYLAAVGGEWGLGVASPLLLALVVPLGWCVSVLVAVLVVLPGVMMGRGLRTALQGDTLKERLEGLGLVALAAFIFFVGVTVTLLVLSVSPTPRYAGRGSGLWLVVPLLGLPMPGVEIVHPVLMWVARACAAMTVTSLVAMRWLPKNGRASMSGI